MKIPKEAIKYILFQRTSYLKNNFLAGFLTWLGHWPLFYRPAVGLKSILFSQQVKDEFNQDMLNEFTRLKPFLPPTVNSILDIGCGIAGIDVLISNYYKNEVGIFLIDKTLVDKKIHYHFENNGSFYNSLPLAKKILELNGVKPEQIQFQEATDDNQINFSGSFDLVISLISWGYHYPLSTYLDEVYNKLNNRGIIILDIRKNTGGEKEIEKKFGNYKIIFETKKYLRIMASK